MEKIRRIGIFFTLMVACTLQFATVSAQTCNGDANSMSLDDDGDGYVNGDETLNGTDKCNSASVPFDFDLDFSSDMLDADDDNDGIADITDKFAQDANNGTATTIPVSYSFKGQDNGGIRGSGFTGLMNSGSDYMSQFTIGDITIGGAAQKFKVSNIPANDALDGTNNQKNAFQFGVKTGAFPFSFVVNGRVMAPFDGITPSNYRSMGIYLGNGDQDNYLKIVCAGNGGAGGIEVVKEVAGVSTSTMHNISILGSTHVNLYLTVNPTTGMVQPAYAVGGGAKTDLGAAIAVPTAWFSNVMAAGIISTSRGATPFSASWDYIAVQPVQGDGNWVNINTGGATTPTARHESGFVQAGNRFIMVGGYGAGKQTQAYNYSSKTWSNAPAPSIPLHHFQAVSINGLVYVVGAFTGDSPNEVPAANVHMFDPANNTWYMGSEIPAARRRGSAAAVVYNEKIYVIGGLTIGHEAGNAAYVDVYDPKTNTWTVLPDAPHARDHFQAAVIGDKIYVTGGRRTGANGTYGATVAETDVYDISEQTWTTLNSPEGDIPTPRADHMVAAIGNEIFAFGGESMAQTGAHNVTEALDVTTGTWRTVDNMNTGRHGTQAVVSNFGVYTVAGATSRGMTPEINTVEAYYPYGTTTATGTAISKGQFISSMSNINFGNVVIGTSSTKTVYLKNPNGNQALIVRSISLSGEHYSFSFPYTLPVAINPGDSLPLQAIFTPGALGTKNGNFTIQNNGSNGGSITIGITGVGQSGQNSPQGYLTAVPGALNFPITDPNVISAPMKVYLTNTGGANVTITGVNITGTNAVNFVHNFASNGMILGVGSTKDFTVTFNPFSSGLKTAFLNVTCSGTNAPISIPLSGTGSGNAATCGYWSEQNGLLVMEVESAPISQGWTSEKAYPNYTGSEYYTWTGPNYFHEKGHGMLTYQFKINNPGKYRFKMRTRQPGPLNTHNNDVWVRFPDHGCQFEKNGQIMATASGWWKQWQNNVGGWTYNTWAGESSFWEVYLDFPFAGVYTMEISGRAQFYSIDRIVMYRPDMMGDWAATAANPPASPWEDCPEEPRVWYRDADLDYYGSPTDSVISVTKPGVGYVWNKLDCDDGAKTVYPGAPELLDGKDNDCDGIKDEGAYLTALNINCGGSAYNTIAGETFESDRLYTTPSNPKFYNGIGDVLGTDDDGLYKAERTSTTTNNFSYNFKAHPGMYTVTLYFAEVSTVMNPGERVFDVQVEDSIILNDLDIIAVAGYKKAYVYTYNLLLTDTVLNVKFIDVIGKAKVSAIKVAQRANTPPGFTLSGSSTFNEDFVGTNFINVVPAAVPAHELYQTVTYSISPASVPFANVSINSATGQVSITAVPNGVGQQQFTVTANDGYAANNIATKNFTLKINAVNDAPDFTLSTGSLNLNEDFAGAQTVDVIPAAVPADEQSQVVTYSLSPASVAFANISINSATGLISITSVAEMSGSQMFTVTANDGQAANNTASKTFILTVAAVNDAPVMNAIADKIIPEDAPMQTVTLSGISAGPNENQTLSITAVSDNVSLIGHPSVSYTSPNTTGSISFIPVANQSGLVQITVTVSDGDLSFDRVFTVTVNPVNDAPVFSMNDITADEDFAGTLYSTVIPGFVPADELHQVVTYTMSPAALPFANISIDSITGKVSVTAIPNANGSTIINVMADDGNNTDLQAFTLTINPVNDAPAFTVSGDINVIEGAYTIATETVIPSAVPADEQSQVVTYSLSPASVSFANVSINSATGEVTITPVADEFGSQLFTITADDGQSINNTYSQTFTLTVDEGNNPPSFVLSGDVTVDEDFTGAQVVSVTPDPVRPHEQSQVVTYSLSPASVSFANIAFDSNTGEVTITAIADEHGSQVFTITADDQENGNNTYAQTFTLTVNPINDAPVFTLSGDITVNEDFATAEYVDVIAGFVPANEQSQVVTYSLSPASVAFANVSINSSTGVVTITSVADASGSQQFTVIADDGDGMHAETFTLTVNAVNDQPTLNAINSPGAVLEDSGLRTISLSGITAGGGENQPLTVTVSSDNPALLATLNVSYTSPATTGTIQFQPAANQWGAATITVTVSDGQALTVQTFVITVTSVNDDPKFALSDNTVTLDEDFAGTHIVTVIPSMVPADETSQAVTYSLSPMSVSFANIAFNSATGEVQITAIADASGSRTFTVMANDGQSQNNVHYETFVLTVNAVNDAPVFTVNPAATVFKNFTSTVTFSVNAGPVPADEQSQAVAYSLAPASISFANVSFNSSTGEVTLTAINNMIGSQQFTITADDQQSVNNLHSEQFMFTVIDTNYQPTLDAIADPAAIAEDAGMQTIDLTGITAGFNETQTVTVSASSSNTALIDPVVSYNNPDNTGSITYAPAANMSGVAVITVKVDDGQTLNNSIEHSFTVTVNPVHDEPEMDAIADVIMNEDDGMQTVAMTGISAGPGESEPLTITAVSDNPSLIADPVVLYNDPSATGALEFTAAANEHGSAMITVTTSDGQLSITRTFTVTVMPVNDAPIVTDIYKQAQEDKTLAFDASAFFSHYSDIDGDPMTKIQIVSLPVNGMLKLSQVPVQVMDEIASFDAKNLIYEPAGDFAGADSFRWNGSDGQLYAVQPAHVYINVNQVNDVPFVVATLADITTDEDAAPRMDIADLGAIFSDIEDGSNMTYTVSNSNESLLDVAVDTDNTLDITFHANAHGIATVIITATDNMGASVEDTFTVTVNSIEDIPSVFTLLTPDDGSVVADPSSIEFTWEHATDGDGDAITYTLTIKGFQLDTTISAASAASLVFNSSALFKKDSTYTWFVTASDGDHFTASATHSFSIPGDVAVHDPYVLVSTVEAYPNPFSANITIRYSLRVDAQVEIKVLNYLGQQVMSFPGEKMPKGEHKMTLNGSELATGIYFYQISMMSDSKMESSFVGRIMKN